MIFLFQCCLSLLPAAWAQITVYNQIPLGQQRSSSTSVDPNAPFQTTLAAYNDTFLIPPPVPSPPPPNTFTIALQRDAAAVPGLSMPHVGGSFFGFSIEMSVINQVLGKNSSFIQVPFLNLMANLQERAGGVVVRLGGNTQEHATMVDFIDHGNVIAKEKTDQQQTTETPAVLYTIDLFYIAANISNLVNVKWFLGIPFNDTANWRLAIAEKGQAILGDNLLGLQAGNEPDLYTNNGHRVEPYGPADYYREFGSLIQTIESNPNIPNKHMLIGPSIEGHWTPEMVWSTGFINDYSAHLYALAVEHYPTNNCAAQFNTGKPIKIPQEEFADYLNHNAGINLIAAYLDSSRLAQEAGKPFIMFETNTASCGGFAGISNSYGAALWGIDYGFQMAQNNFTHALLHVGGQNVYYNPFTAPPTNQSVYNQWTIGTIYYSTLVIAEAFGKTNTSRIVDLWPNDRSLYTPAYAIYEQDTLSKVALFNYIDDNSGAQDLRVALSVPNSGVPPSVRVKYLEADSVSMNNVTWAGQSFGSKFDVDGRFKGDLNVTTIQCDQTANTCIVPVKAPGFALVFFNDDAPLLSVGQSPVTFSTTAYTKTHNTLRIDPSLLATSNGHSGKDRVNFGSTSKGSVVNGVNGRGDGLRCAVALLSGIAVGTVLVLMGI